MARTILIVDDNEFNVEIINQLIQKYSKDKQYPINILIANNGQEAVDLCNVKNVDLIFMDLMMPVMGGLEAIVILKKQDITANIPIIVISASVYKEQQKNSLLLGSTLFIGKPFVLEQVTDAVQQCLGLKWQYNQKTPQKTMAVTGKTHLNTRQIKDLYSLLEQGDRQALQTYIKQIKIDLDIALYSKIQSFIKNFDDDAFYDLLTMSN